MPQVLSNVKIPVACSIIVMTQAIGACSAQQCQEGFEEEAIWEFAHI